MSNHIEGELTGRIAADGKSPERWVKAHSDGCRGGECNCSWMRGYYADDSERVSHPSSSEARQEGGKATPPTWPEIPKYLKEPTVFEDKNLGIVMVAIWGTQQWLFRVHDGHWCSVRRTTDYDPVFIQPLNHGEAKPEAPAPKQSIPCTCDGDDCPICYPSDKQEHREALTNRPDLQAPAPQPDSQTGLRCPKCGNTTSLNIRNSYRDERPEETTVTCYSSPCGYRAHIDKFRLERESQPSRSIEEVAKEWLDKWITNHPRRTKLRNLFSTISGLLAEFYRYTKGEGL